MATYAAATAELVRLSGIAGIKARRAPRTISGTLGTALYNNLFVSDGRIADQKQADDSAITDAATEPLTGPGTWKQYEVGSSSVYPRSDTTFS